jgi:hypothetical protein
MDRETTGSRVGRSVEQQELPCAVVETMLKVAAGKLDEAAFAGWLAPKLDLPEG